MEAEGNIKKLQNTLSKEYGKQPLAWKVAEKQNESVKGDADKVRKSINKSIEKIQAVSGQLASYLNQNIKSGSEWKFTGNPNDWEIIF